MKKVLAVFAALAISLTGASAFAYSVKVDDDTFAGVGVKGQVRFQMTNPDANHDRVDVLGFQGRIYASGQVTNLVKFGMNFDMGRGRTTSPTWLPTAANANTSYPAGLPTSTASLSDLNLWFDVAKELKINTGIYRMAVSRKALQDTYQTMFVTQPDVAGSGFIAGVPTGGAALAGYRGAGLTFWGDLAAGMLRYNVGFWDGDYAPTVSGLTNPDDTIGYTARVVMNFMDPEKGYTCAGCYLGKAKIANIGLGYLQWDDLGAAKNRTYTVTTIDAFYDADNLTAEAGYFMYDYDNPAGQKPTGWYLELGYAAGKIQPAIRYEMYDDDVAAHNNTDYDRLTVALNYLLAGHDAKIQLEYAKKNFDGTGIDTDTFTTQIQVQF